MSTTKDYSPIYRQHNYDTIDAETDIEVDYMEQNMLRPVAEMRYAAELEALAQWDIENPKPQGWKLSPKAVRTFILGSAAPIGGVTIGKKYLGNDALVERCIITLAGNRGLMLVGEPDTAKTMLSELLSAAISGSSTNTVQGTA